MEHKVEMYPHFKGRNAAPNAAEIMFAVSTTTEQLPREGEAQSSVTFSFTYSSDLGLSLTIFLRNLIVSNPPDDQQGS